jgi:signal transduction histidine kinase
MSHWIFPTLSEILAHSDDASRTVGTDHRQQVETTPHSGNSVAEKQLRAEREWFGAIAALESLLQQTDSTDTLQGLVLSAPLPVLSQPELLKQFSTWSFTANPCAILSGAPFQLLPSLDGADTPEDANDTLSVLPGDPIAAEPFCLVLTRRFSLAIVLGEDAQKAPAFSFSFDPDVIDQMWQNLRLRVMLMNPARLKKLDTLYKEFSPVAPDYKVVTQFSHTLLRHLPEFGERETSPRLAWSTDSKESPLQSEADQCAEVAQMPESLKSLDVELLQAIAHEVRTPLSTIRTFTRLLLKRKDLPPDVIKRLEIIDRECSEQIDRFGLIFRAVEIETSATKLETTSLALTSLSQVLEQSVPRWQKQACQRNLTLDVILPQHLPPVMSNPAMLDQALTSLIERSARSLPAGSRIQVEVSLAGHQLKLQLQSQVKTEKSCETASGSQKHHTPLLKSLGQVLMFQPETGSLSLNLSVTKHLFQALGAKLIVRERPEQGEVFTLFLPLEPTKRSFT